MSININNAIQKLQQETNQITIAELDEDVLMRLLSKLDPEMLQQRCLTEADAQRLAKQIGTMKHGVLAHTPMLCGGRECPQADECTLYQLGIHPIGAPCPWEELIMENLMGSMVRELAVNPDNPIEMSMLSDLIQAEIMDMRATHQVAKVGLTQEQPSAVDRDGNVIYREEEAVVIQIQEKLKNRKDKLRRRFLADREARAKYKSGDQASLANTLSDLVLKLQAKGEALEAETEDVQFEDVTEDEDTGDRGD
jgi:hypothetical protein